MKKTFDIKLLFIFSIASLLVSCEINDPVDNVVRVGQVAPHVYWELPTSSVTAGTSVPFYAQYYTIGDAKVDHLEVWYDVNENIQRLVSCPLVTTFKYSISSSNTTLSREFQKIESFTHYEKYWLGAKRAYILDTAFQTSKTLRTVEWKEVKEFDETKFNAYFSTTYAQQFKDSMYKLLKVADFRKILVSLNKMTDAEFITYTDSVKNDNTGGYDKFIIESKKPELKAKYDAILFKELIYDSSAQIYKVEYTKNYKLSARFKAIDNNQVVGISDKKEIDLR